MLGAVGEEILNQPLGLAPDAIEIQLQQKMLVWNLVRGFQGVQYDYISLAAIVNFTCKVFYFED